MMQLLFFALVAGAAAFTPQVAVLSQSKLSASFDDAVGVQAPTGYWDPLGFLVDADQSRFDRLRYVETKHGRIAMLAMLGDLTTRSGVHLPGAIDKAGTQFADVKDGWEGITSLGAQGVGQIVLFIGFL